MAIKTDAYYASCTYDSPVGMLTLAASEEGLKGLWLNGQKYFPCSRCLFRALGSTASTW